MEVQVNNLTNINQEFNCILETENFIAYQPNRPDWDVHIIIEPKNPIQSILALNDNELIIEMTRALRLVTTMVKDKHGEANVMTNVGDQQSEDHLHWHIYKGSRLR